MYQITIVSINHESRSSTFRVRRERGGKLFRVVVVQAQVNSQVQNLKIRVFIRRSLRVILFQAVQRVRERKSGGGRMYGRRYRKPSIISRITSRPPPTCVSE
jgi:hypothetical protein